MPPRIRSLIAAGIAILAALAGTAPALAEKVAWLTVAKSPERRRIFQIRPLGCVAQFVNESLPAELPSMVMGLPPLTQARTASKGSEPPSVRGTLLTAIQSVSAKARR